MHVKLKSLKRNLNFWRYQSSFHRCWRFNIRWELLPFIQTKFFIFKRLVCLLKFIRWLYFLNWVRWMNIVCCTTCAASLLDFVFSLPTCFISIFTLAFSTLSLSLFSSTILLSEMMSLETLTTRSSIKLIHSLSEFCCSSFSSLANYSPLCSKTMPNKCTFRILVLEETSTSLEYF